jgi:hypothetical protein
VVCTPGMWHQNENLKLEVRIFRMISGPFPNRMGHLVSAAVPVKTVGSVALEPTRSLGFATSRE